MSEGHVMRRFVLGGLIALVPMGCGETQRPITALVRDSSGVRIIEYSSKPSGDRLPIDRIFRVGWEDGEPTFESDTWPTPGQVRQDGFVVIGDYNGKQLYAVDADSAAIRKIGQRGQGPGEYEEILGVVLVGDTVVVQDDSNVRLTRFGLDGGVRIVPWGRVRGYEISSTHPRGFLMVPIGGDRPTVPGWGTSPILLLDSLGQVADTIAVLPFVYVRPVGDRNPIRLIASAVGLPSGGFVYARNDRAEVVWFDDTGRLQQVVRWTEEAAAASDRDWERYEEWSSGRILVEVDEAGAERRLVQARRDFAGPMPLFGRVFASEDGSVWVSSHSFGLEPEFLDGFDSRGRSLGRVVLPNRFTPIDVNGAYLLGWEFSRLDVPALSLYRVSLPNSS